jgi:hypothetical protein
LVNSTTKTLEELMGSDNSLSWLIDGMLPEGHKGMIANLEGGCKTTILAWVAICVALGKPVFGMPTQQGKVVMIDEETPWDSFERKLNRFALGFGFNSYQEIQGLTLLWKQGYRFSHKNTEILEKIKKEKPVLVTIDALISCLPSGKQGLEENNSKTGIAVRDDLDKIIQASTSSSILIAAHSSKTTVGNFEVEDYQKAEMTELVRGHGSLVGEACDTGYGLFKISEKPLRFVIIPKPRREPIPMNNIYVEMKEESYGEGWARLEKIEPLSPPPSQAAIDLSTLFTENCNNEITAKEIRSQAATYTPSEVRLGLQQLRRRGVIITTRNNFSFKLNPELSGIDHEYLKQLKRGKSE